MKNINKNFLGTTLIEFMVVIGIISFISVIGIGFIKQYQPNLKLFTQTKELKSALNMAREKTINEQTEYGIKIFIQENRYDFIKIDSPTIPIESHILPNEVFIFSSTNFTDNIIKFNKAGAALENGIIILENILGEQKTITINPSGYVKTE